MDIGAAPRRTTGKQPTEIERHIAARIRARRHEIGLSQKALGKALGVAFQQVQKYEKGTNRITAGSLYQIALMLDAPIGYFFEGLPAEKPDPSPDAFREHADHEVKVQANVDAERRNARARGGE